VTVAAARALVGVKGGDHICCAFGSEAEQEALVVRFARDAISRRERLVYMCDGNDEGTIRSFLDVAGIDSSSHLASGQLRIDSAREAYGGADGFDPECQIAHFEIEKRRAYADGFSGLAAMAEMSWALEAPWDTVVSYEREVQQVFGTAAVRGVCEYDRRIFPADMLDEVAAAHELWVGVDHRSSCARWRTTTIRERADLPGLEVSGELDMATSAYLAARLAEHLITDADIELDVAALTFADVSGCRAIAETALALDPPRRLILKDATPCVRRVLELCGWSAIPALELGAERG
jgi:anti-anti-sigma factor